MVVVCTPSRDSVCIEFAYDLSQLIRKSNAYFAVGKGSVLPNLRNALAKGAIETGASHLLFIDSDMRFPPDTVERLLRAGKDVVGANCKQRTQDEFTARRDGRFVGSVGRSGVEEVDTIGFGVTMIRTDIFKRMKKPWFSLGYDPVSDKHNTDDVYFCIKAREAGVRIFVDHDLSREVKHIGQVEFGV